MGHPTIENNTGFAFEPIHLSNEDGRPVLVTLFRATFELRRRVLVLAEKQEPIPIAGQLYGESADVSSYRYEPETSYVKPGTDIVLIGHAVAMRAQATELDVGIQVGRVQRTARVVGDRVWLQGGGMTSPLPFERMPLVWERSFGGWDRTAGTPEKPEFDPRNPVGTGFRSPNGVFQEGVRLPNIENRSERLTSYGQVVTPVGFGFVSANWQSRAMFAGTYDGAWIRDRMPLLPRDFDKRFYNAAAPGLVSNTYLRGGEPVSLVGLSPMGTLDFSLPIVAPPRCRVALRRRPDATVDTVLDTVVINLDEDRVFLGFRGHLPLRDGPHDVAAIHASPSDK
jgi:hypothetical protein